MYINTLCIPLIFLQIDIPKTALDFDVLILFIFKLNQFYLCDYAKNVLSPIDAKLNLDL